jgi:hypothetical protein
VLIVFLPPFAAYAAFPRSDYYGGSALDRFFSGHRG